MQCTILATLLAYFSGAYALHFMFQENSEPFCFTLDLGKDALVSEKHSAWQLETSSQKWVRDNNLKIEVTIDELFDNKHRVYHHKTAPFGEFQFIAQDGGEHELCYKAISDGWWSHGEVKLEVDHVYSVGESAVDVSNSRKLGYMGDRLAELTRKFVHIRSEQKLMREREAQFRDSSENANSKVVFTTIVQLCVLAAACAWQVTHLQSFFVKQKLI